MPHKNPCRFWDAFDKRQLETLATYKADDDIDGDTITHAALLALYQKDLDLLKSLDFYHRALLELVARKPMMLKLLLSVLEARHFPNPLPIYVPVTRENITIFNSFFEKHGLDYCYLRSLSSER
jgi:hypothetical protein